MRIITIRTTLLLSFFLVAFLGKGQKTYNTVGVIGSATPNGWDVSTAMKMVRSNYPHLWQVTLQLSPGEVKFRANNNWDVSWGNSPFPSGIAVPGGANIQVPIAGKYMITFHDLTGDYSFDAVNYSDPQRGKMKKSERLQRTTTSTIFPENAAIKEIFSNGQDFLEGPVMSPDGLLYFTDFPSEAAKQIKTGIIWTLNPETGKYNVFRSPSGMANGLKFDANGDLIVCEQARGGRRVTKTDMKTGITTIIAGQYRSKPFNSPNDLSIDKQGRIYFTDPSYVVNVPAEQNGMGIYRIDKDSSVHLVAANVNKPNGIATSPDQKTLYVVNCDFPGNGNRWFLTEEKDVVGPNGEGSVFAYDLKEDGSLRVRSKLINFGNSIGPDGMTVDADGNLYIAIGSRVVVYDPNGNKLTEIKCPQATNLCFGRGKFSKTLFIAGGKSIYMVGTNKEGDVLPSKNR
jgi:gluconolactonase